MARPQLTDDAVDATRKRLVLLALELYRSEGLEAISFRRLADAAGISHTLPYRYFRNKEAVLVAVRVACTEHFNAYVRARESAHGLPMRRVREIAAAYVSFVTEHADDYLLIFSLHQPPPSRYPELLAARRDLFDHVTSVVQQAIDAGALQGDARALAHLFWVSLHGLMTLHVAGQLVHGHNMETLLEPLIEQMLRAPLRTPGGPLNEHETP